MSFFESFINNLSFLNIFNYGFFGVASRAANGDALKAVFFAMGFLFSMLEGYFIGAFSPAIYFSKKLFGEDVRKSGSGNAGSTNMLRTHGKKAGLMTAGGDLLKGITVCLIGYILFGYNGASIAGLFAVVGHIAPIYYGFKGGKGVMVAAASLLMLDPIIFLICLLLFVAIVALTKYVSLGSVMLALIYPLIFARVNGSLGIPFLSVLLSGAIIIFMHRSNIKRLMDGKENKLSFGKKDKSEKEESEDEVNGITNCGSPQAENLTVKENKPQPKSKKNQRKSKK